MRRGSRMTWRCCRGRRPDVRVLSYMLSGKEWLKGRRATYICCVHLASGGSHCHCWLAFLVAVLWGQYFSVLRLAEECRTHWGGAHCVVRDVVPENEAEGDATWVASDVALTKTRARVP